MSEQTRQRALTLLQSGRIQEAEALSRELLAANPANADLHVLLALVLTQRGDAAEAVDCLKRAVDLEPARADLQMNCATLLMQLGDIAAAARCYASAARLEPGRFQAFANHGIALVRLRRFEEAEVALRDALAIRPDSEPALTALAGTLHAMGRIAESEQAARKAVAAAPDGPEAWTNLGQSLQTQGRLGEAAEAYERALAVSPRYALALYNLSHVLNEQWRGADALAGFRKAVELEPSYQPAWHAYLFHLLYSADETEETIHREHSRWGQRFADNDKAAERRTRSRDEPGQRIRVGYVSPDFRAHSCAYFLQPLFAAHDRTRFEIFAYANIARPDAVTAWFSAHADAWRDIRNIDDTAVADMVRADAIDVLVDLGGHTANHPIGVFALRPAPVQIAWLGYPATSGLEQIGYRLTDVVADPAGQADQFSTEKLLRLPGGFFCYQPPGNAPPVAPLPAARNGYVTFGSFNNLSKMTPATVAAWARLMRSVPGSRLVLKGRMLARPEARARILQAFSSGGVHPSRVDLQSWTQKIEDSLAAYSSIDIALDTFPYNGTTTTLEALWMGVPVITMRGDRHAGRVGASILTNLGRPQWIAADAQHYVAAAIALAADLPRLAELRTRIRNDLARSILCDSKGFARKMEAVFRDLLAQTGDERTGRQD